MGQDWRQQLCLKPGKANAERSRATAMDGTDREEADLLLFDEAIVGKLLLMCSKHSTEALGVVGCPAEGGGHRVASLGPGRKPVGVLVHPRGTRGPPAHLPLQLRLQVHAHACGHYRP